MWPMLKYLTGRLSFQKHFPARHLIPPLGTLSTALGARVSSAQVYLLASCNDAAAERAFLGASPYLNCLVVKLGRASASLALSLSETGRAVGSTGPSTSHERPSFGPGPEEWPA